jgi:hypothetical protein
MHIFILISCYTTHPDLYIFVHLFKSLQINFETIEGYEQIRVNISDLLLNASNLRNTVQLNI